MGNSVFTFLLMPLWNLLFPSYNIQKRNTYMTYNLIVSLGTYVKSIVLSSIM